MRQRYIYIVFSKTGTWLSHSISKIAKIDYPHVSLSFNENLDCMYTFGRIKPNNPFSGGLVIENIHEGIYRKSKNVHCIIYKIPITDYQLICLKYEIDKYFSINKIYPYKYNFIGLFGILLNKPIKRKKHYFCSQFVSSLLHNSSIWTSSKCHELTGPNDIMKINQKVFVYKGLIRDFVN